MTDFVPNFNPKPELPPEKATLSHGPGRLLADARKRAGRSVEDIASCLYVSPRVIDGIERDDFENLPPTTFVRGYLRTYANEVGVDPDEILKQHKRFTGEDGIHSSEPPRTLGSTTAIALPRWLPIAMWWGGVVVLICAIVISVSLWGNSAVKGVKSAFQSDPTDASVSSEIEQPVLLSPRNSEADDELIIDTE